MHIDICQQILGSFELKIVSDYFQAFECKNITKRLKNTPVITI